MVEHSIRYRSSATTEGDVQRVLSKLEASERDLAIVRLVANWKSGFRPFVLMADSLLVRGALPAEVREAVVLQIAAVRELAYEWQEHVPIAERAGLSARQIEVLSTGWPLSDPTPFSPAQLSALTFVAGLLDGGPFDGRAWDTAADELGLDAALELVFAVAWWAGFVPTATHALFSIVDDAETIGRT